MKEAHENIESGFLKTLSDWKYESLRHKRKIDWRKSEFKYTLKNTYGIENRNYMMPMHNDKVNKISEFNLLHDIINPPKHNRNLHRHYYPIGYGCIHTREGREKLKNSRVILDSECSCTIVMGRLVENYILK